MRELPEVQSPFVYLEELDKKSGALLRVGEQLVTNGDWDDLPEYKQEIEKIVKEFERVPVLLEQTHERILEDQRRREAERLAEEERQRLEREERLRLEAEYAQAIATFRTSFSTFITKPNWSNTNAAIAAGEAVESNPMFVNDARRGAISTHVPRHWTPDDSPIGVMFSARFGEDATLFRLAAQLEKAQLWDKRKPTV